MKVILLKDVGGVGKRDALVDVSDGHALNSLIPRGQAIQATPESIRELSLRIKAHTEAGYREESKLKEALLKLRGKEFILKSKANEKGRLFKKVGAGEIADLVAQNGTNIKVSMLGDVDIKNVGTYEYKITSDDTEAIFKVIVVGN